MYTKVQVTVRNSAALKAQLKRMSKAAKSEAVDISVRAGAELIKRSIQDKIREQGLVDSGALLKSVLISRGTSRATRVISYEVTTEVVGDYDWVHEFGATIEPRNAPFLVFEIDGYLVFTKRVVIPARPFFRPGMDEARYEAHAAIRETFLELVIGRNTR